MGNGEDCKWRVEDNDNLEGIGKGLCGPIVGQKTQQTVHSKHYGHEGACILTDQLKFLVLPVIVPYTHVVKGPEGRQKKGDKDRNSGNHEEPGKLKLALRYE